MNAYPLPRQDNDARFNAGLIFDVRRLLRDHGYPPITGSRDLVRLHMALFTFLYGGHQEIPDDGRPTEG